MTDLFQELFGAKPVDDAEQVRRLIDGSGNTEELVQPLQAGDRLRASGIEAFCPRFEALRHKNQIVLRERVASRLNRIFVHGRIFEKMLRDRVFGPLNLLVGAWTCIRCGALHGAPTTAGAIAQPRTCQCGGQQFDYVEPSGMIAGTNVGGSGDGFIRWKGEKCLLEIKTCKDKIFQKVSAKRWPLPNHVSQTQVYLEVFDLRKSLHWYYNKNTSEHLPLWTVRSAETVERLVAKANAFKAYHDTGNLPDRLCQNVTCDRAKTCVLRDVCFTGEDSKVI